MQNNLFKSSSEKMPLLRDWFGNTTPLVSANETMSDGFMKLQKAQSLIVKDQ